MRRDVRAVPRALVLAAVLLVAARVGAQLYERAHPPAWADLVHWKTAAEASDALAMHDRPVLYDFSASWCEPCQLMRQEVFSEEEGAGLVDSFLPVRIDDDDHTEAATAVRSRFVTTALPTMIVTGPQLARPLVLAGYPGREQTIAFLKEAYGQAAGVPVPGVKIEVGN